MIRINLLPQQATGSKGAAAPSSPSSSGGLVVGLAIVAILAVVVVAGFGVLALKKRSDAKLASVRDDLAAVNKEISSKKKEAEEIEQAIAALQNQVKVLNTLNPTERLYWAEKMNMLPLIVPEGIYLTELKVTQDVKEVETKASQQRAADWEKKPANTRGPRPPRDVYPVIRQTLIINGIAYVQDGTSDQRLQLIIDFMDALQTKTVKIPFSGKEGNFMDFFEPRVQWESFEDKNMAGRTVQAFQLSILSKPIGGSPDEAAAQ